MGTLPGHKPIAIVSGFPTLSVTVTQQSGDGIGFTLGYTGTGYIEVCKASCPTNPLTSNNPTNYYFTVPGSAFSSPPGIQVPLGECSGSIPVSAGMPIIMELPTPGVSACMPVPPTG